MKKHGIWAWNILVSRDCVDPNAEGSYRIQLDEK